MAFLAQRVFIQLPYFKCASSLHNQELFIMLTAFVKL
jgi:hypothetical protein